MVTKSNKEGTSNTASELDGEKSKVFVSLFVPPEKSGKWKLLASTSKGLTPEKFWKSDLIHELLLHVEPAFEKHMKNPKSPGYATTTKAIAQEEMAEHADVTRWKNLLTFVQHDNQELAYEVYNDIANHAESLGLKSTEVAKLRALARGEEGGELPAIFSSLSSGGSSSSGGVSNTNFGGSSSSSGSSSTTGGGSLSTGGGAFSGISSGGSSTTTSSSISKSIPTSSLALVPESKSDSD